MCETGSGVSVRGNDRLELRVLIKKGGDTGKIVKKLANPKKERRCLQRTT